MRTGNLPGAVAAWHAATIARGKPPTPQRVARIIEKLQEPDAAYVAAEGEAIVGMALAEPCRKDDGAGAVIPGALHISMVFVFPSSAEAEHQRGAAEVSVLKEGQVIFGVTRHRASSQPFFFGLNFFFDFGA